MKNLRPNTTTILLKVITCVLVLTFASCDDDDDGYGAIDQRFNSEYLV